MKYWQRVFAILLMLAATANASAHEGSTSYLTVDSNREGSPATGRFEAALIDLAWTLPLDGDADGRLRWNEILDRHAEIAATLGEGLRFVRGGGACETQIGEPWLTERLGLPYLSVDVVARCPAPGLLEISSSLFFDGDAYHRVLISAKTAAATHTATLAPGSRRWTEPATVSGWRTALEFLRQGVWHVWTGYDHLIFLLLLLLPSVVRRTAVTAGRGRAIALDLARIVTAFTVAHSITLGLAATALVRLPQQPIEVAIAVSLIIAGMLNLAPRLMRLRLPLAFGFGLVHGFGFANALAGLDTGAAAVLPVLAGFNIGVELANLAVIAAVLPVLLWAGRYTWYAPRAMPALSLVAAAIGAMWMIQRI